MIYGNATADVYKLSNQATFLDKLFSPLTTELTNPLGEKSPEIKQQLSDAKELCIAFFSEPELQYRYRLFDSLYQYIIGYVKYEDDEQATAYYRSIVRSLFNDVVPLVYKLKLHYQQPRPFQLAALHNIALYPETSVSAGCPSYPSMHACMARVISVVCTDHFPALITSFQELEKDIPQSRLSMGLCLKSDLDCGYKVADHILSEVEFKIKYKL